MDAIVYILIGVCTIGMILPPITRVITGIISIHNPASHFNNQEYRKKIIWRTRIIGGVISLIGVLGIIILF